MLDWAVWGDELTRVCKSCLRAFIVCVPAIVASMLTDMDVLRLHASHSLGVVVTRLSLLNDYNMSR